MDGDTNEFTDIFVRDTLDGSTARVSIATDGTQGNHDSHGPSISADGRYVAFESDASNLVDGDTNNTFDVFVRDTVEGTTTLVSVATDGTQGNDASSGPSISADGRYVAFESDASNLVDDDTNNRTDVFLRDTVEGTTTLVSVATDGTRGNDQSLPTVDQRRRTLRRLPLLGDELRRRSHPRRAGRLPPRHRGRDHRAPVGDPRRRTR